MRASTYRWAVRRNYELHPELKAIDEAAFKEIRVLKQIMPKLRTLSPAGLAFVQSWVNELV